MIESKRAAEESSLVREELKQEERLQDERYQLSRSINFASLRLEKSYRELCRSKKIDDVLGLKHSDQQTVEFKELDATATKPKIKVLPDPRLKNPIWRAMYARLTSHEEKQQLKEQASPEEVGLEQLELSKANIKLLRSLWQEILEEATQEKQELQKKSVLLATRRREILGLQTMINDRKSVPVADQTTRILSYKMRDLKRLQETERVYRELRRSQQLRSQQKMEEEWDSRFESLDHSLDLDHSPKLGYNRLVESKLNLLLGAEAVDQLATRGRAEARRKPQSADHTPEKPAVAQESEDQPEGDLGDLELAGDSAQASPKKDSKLEEELPLHRTAKPWEEKDPDDRTEVRLGVKYDKPFETQFDDRLVLAGRKPIRVVRVVANFTRDFVVGVQFTYMTEEQELVQGRLHGNNKRILDNLRTVQYEVQFREKIEKMVAHFSKGIHWLELTTNEGRVLLLGNKQTHATAVTQTKSLDPAKQEEVAFVSGGFTGRDYRFTFLSFHLLSGWNLPKKEEFA